MTKTYDFKFGFTVDRIRSSEGKRLCLESFCVCACVFPEKERKVGLFPAMKKVPTAVHAFGLDQILSQIVF